MYRGSNFDIFCIGGKILAIFCIGASNFDHFCIWGVTFWPFLYRGSKRKKCCIGVKKMLFLSRGFSKMHFFV